jgi:hypothetical protein
MPAAATAEGVATSEPQQEYEDDPDWEDYERFVQSLWTEDDKNNLLWVDEDEEEFQALEEDEDDDDDDDDDEEGDLPTQQPNPPLTTTTHPSDNDETPEELDMIPDNFYQELAEELGWLEEEDMEAAVATLLDQHPKQPKDNYSDEMTTTTSPQPQYQMTDMTTCDNDSQQPHSTPLRESARSMEVTPDQYDRLRQLMQLHHQLLLQQAVLAARAAHSRTTTTTPPDVAASAPAPAMHNSPVPPRSTESADDLVEILDGAVGMLQDLDQNRRDAVRHSIQFVEATKPTQPLPRRSLFPPPQGGGLRLTRAQFSKTLQQQETQGRRQQEETVFGIQGLSRLNETFVGIDKSVGDKTSDDGSVRTKMNNNREEEMDLKESHMCDCLFVVFVQNEEACRKVLLQSGAKYDPNWLPGARDLSENFVDVKDILRPDFAPPCNEEKETILRRNRNLFTSGEDNLVLRGVNLYGEKQWVLLGDRFLPDRSVNIISQRYSKLCLLLYKANGILINDKGMLETPPKMESVDDVDEAVAAKLEKVSPPAVLNVHRWSMEEDLTMLKAVPVFGTMWAEIAARYLPHRDRGHIRKRYLVLQRRIKATVTREKKSEEIQKHQSRAAASAPAKKAPVRKAQEAPPALQPPMKRQRPQPPPPPPKALPPQQQPQRPPPPQPQQQPQHHPPPQPQPQHHPPQHYPQHHPQHPPQHHPQHPPQHHPQHHPQQHPQYWHPHHQYQYAVPMSPPLRRVIDHSLEKETATLLEEGSRAAFEQLVQDSNQEESQRAKTESDTENMKVPGRKSRPSPDWEDSTGGFSMLDSYRPASAKKDPRTNGLLAGVLKHAEDRQRETDTSRSAPKSDESALQKLSSVAAMNLMPPPSKGTDGSDPSSYHSPKKSKKMSVHLETPTRHDFPLTAGTPTLFSPAFGSLFSPENPLKFMGSPSMTMATFPGGESSNLALPAVDLYGHSMDGQDLKNMFEGATNSRHSVGLKLDEPETPSPAKSSPESRSYNSNATPLFGEGATLMENDLEAISALNSMSSPPAVIGGAKSISPRDSSAGTSGSASTLASKCTSKEGKSLFAKVIGKSRPAAPTKKRKLQF